MRHIKNSPPHVAAGRRTLLAALCAAMSLAGCKKDIAEPSRTTKTATPNVASMARTLTDAETSALVTEIEQFHTYALKFAEDPNVTPDQALPLSTKGDQATGFLENAFNYYYARLNDDLFQRKRDSFVVRLDENRSGEVDLNNVAGAFNAALLQIKSDYAALGSLADKQLTLVDVSWEDAGSQMIFTVAYDFSWEAGAKIANPTNSSFPAGTEWNWATIGGKRVNGTVSLLGVDGAPGQLRQKIRANLGYFDIQYFHAPIPVNIVLFEPGDPGFASMSQSNTNPWATQAPISPALRFWSADPSTYSSVQWLPPSALNFYRTEIKAMIHEGEAYYGKGFTDLNIFSTVGFLGSTPVSYLHRVQVLLADFIPANNFPPISL